MLARLPTPLQRTFVPEVFPVSSVANYRCCKLRLLASARELKESHLISGPQAALGSVVHRTYERWAKESGMDPLALFDDEVRREARTLAADSRRSHFSDLTKTRSFVEWRNLRATVKARCATISKSRPARQIAADSLPHPNANTGPEKWLKSASLRLVGRADRIDRSTNGLLNVRDFKTGRVFDEDGQVLPETSLQLRLYALLVEAAWPGCEVELTLEIGGAELSITWDADAKTETLRHLTSATESLSTGTELDCPILARIGSECCHCPIRHRCTAYLNAAPGWWNQIPQAVAAIPADTWGTLTSITSRSDLIEIQLKDAAGREISVTGLRDRTGFSAIRPGDTLFFFGVERTGSGIGWNGQQFQPHAFHELPPDKSLRRAWALEIFHA